MHDDKDNIHSKTYVIGDVNGDIDSLSILLEKVGFDEAVDKLWFTGNLVNQGQHNVEVLRLVKGLGKQAVTVLGAQELRLLAIAEGIREAEPHDSLEDILAAPDRVELIKWLAARPFLHHQNGYTMVHAGIPPEWTLSQVRTFAIEAESSLSMGNRRSFLENIQGDQPTRWHAKHRGWNRTRFIVNALTRMHYLNAKGRLVFDTQASNDVHYTPWYDLGDRQLSKENVLFSNMHLKLDNCTTGILPINQLLGTDGLLRAVQLTPVPHNIELAAS